MIFRISDMGEKRIKDESLRTSCEGKFSQLMVLDVLSGLNLQSDFVLTLSIHVFCFVWFWTLGRFIHCTDGFVRAAIVLRVVRAGLNGTLGSSF